jgi:hypothetical protein
MTPKSTDLAEAAAPALAPVEAMALTPAFAPAPAAVSALAPAPVPELDLSTRTAEPAAALAPVAPLPVIGNIAFDLAKAPRAQAPLPPGSAFAGQPRHAASTIAATRAQTADPARQYRQTGHGIEFTIPAVLFGEVVGKVPLRVAGANLVSVRLGDLLELVRGRMDPAAFARLSGSRQTQEYVGFSTLRDAGIDLRYDAARDRLILGE